MRVTNKYLADSVTSNFYKNTEQLLKAQTLVSSGKKINKPSDDPIGIGKVLDYRKKISSIDQYARNINHGQAWLGITDSTLGDVDNLLIRAKEQAVYQASETANADTRAIAAEEIVNIYDQIIQLGNTKFGNSYIFSGHAITTSPFDRDDDFNATYHGNDGDISLIIGENVEININTIGDEAFTGQENIFDILRDLKDGLEANDTSLISEQIERLDGALNQILEVRAEVGAKLNRLESTENYWINFKFSTEELLSDTEDADIAKAMTDLAVKEAAYQASLAASARIIQPSLIQFLG